MHIYGVTSPISPISPICVFCCKKKILDFQTVELSGEQKIVQQIVNENKIVNLKNYFCVPVSCNFSAKSKIFFIKKPAVFPNFSFLWL